MARREKTYADCIAEASDHKTDLNKAIENFDGNPADLIYYRGNYIAAIREAYALDSDAEIPDFFSEPSFEEEIKKELREHQSVIEAAIKMRKVDPGKAKKPLGSAWNLVSEHANTTKNLMNLAETEEAKLYEKKKLLKDNIKRAAMVPTKVISKVGPVIIWFAILPLSFVAAGVKIFSKLGDGKEIKSSDYNDTIIHQMSKELRTGFEKIFDALHNKIGRL